MWSTRNCARDWILSILYNQYIEKPEYIPENVKSEVQKQNNPNLMTSYERCLSNNMELWTTSFIESTGVACSDSVNHNQVHVLRILVLLLACSQDWTCNLQMIVSLEV